MILRSESHEKYQDVTGDLEPWKNNIQRYW